MRGSVSHGVNSNVNLDRISNSRQAVARANACVPDFVRRPRFTDRIFFSDSSVAMLINTQSTSDCIANDHGLVKMNHLVGFCLTSRHVSRFCSCSELFAGIVASAGFL